MLNHRIPTALLITAFALGVFYFDGWLARATAGTAVPPGSLLLLLLIVIVIPAAKELAGLLRHKQVEVSPGVLAVAAIATGATIWISHGCGLGAVAVGTVLVASFFGATLWHCRNASPPGAMTAAGGTTLAAVYLGVCGGLFLAIRHEHAAWVVLGVLIITKSCDVGAYTAGHALGKRKLIPWLSPGKTWEGLAGGVVLSVVVAIILALVSQRTELGAVYREIDGETVAIAQQYHLAWAALMGLLLAIIGHAGDLTMSLFKRDAGVKDSSSSMPGFGGVLDIIDSPLLIAPVAYWMLKVALIN